MRRRRFLLLVPVLAGSVFAEGRVPVRGKLVRAPGNKPALRTADGKLVLLSGDADSMGVLEDERLASSDFEAIGKWNGDLFAIDPIHLAALYVYKDGKRLRVTYWCDVCAIRTYTPGLCWCCREETAVDLRDPDKVDTK